jgi:hypothetical protein
MITRKVHGKVGIALLGTFMSTWFGKLGRWPAALVILALLAATGYALFAARGEQIVHQPDAPPGDPKHGADLKYYRQVVGEVREGANYYDVANRELRYWGFSVGSVFNWRLPTYAYLLALLPGEDWIQGVLVLIGVAGLCLAFVAECKDIGLLGAGGTALLLVGVVHWSVDSPAYLAQEVWAGLLILVSVAAYGMGWPWLAVGSGLLALFFRELVLPYCLIAAGLAWLHQRRGEFAAWLGGILLFGLYLAWHAGQVGQRLTPADTAASKGMLEWVQFGGLTFDLLATRMNAYLFDAPGWIVAVYLVVAVAGLLGWRSEQGVRLTLTTLVYLAAFSVIGMKKNINWGLMFAPMLPFGVVRAPEVMWQLGEAARGRAEAASPGAIAAQPEQGCEGVAPRS